MQSKNENKGAGFDLDAVLFDNYKFEKQVVPFCIDMMFKEYPSEKVNAQKILMRLKREDPNSRTHFDDLCRELGFENISPRLVAIGMNAYEKKKVELIKRDEKVITFLDYFKQKNYKLFVVTMGIEKNQWGKLNLTEEDIYFTGISNGVNPNKDSVYVLKDSERMSPAEKIEGKEALFLEAIDNLRINLKKCFVVDDREYGLEAARRAGVNVLIRVMQGKYVNETCSEFKKYSSGLNYYEVKELSEIPAILERFR